MSSGETPVGDRVETSPTPTIARIARIALSDYRAFPGGPPYEFDLGATGKNLLLYGENGSGKTSLFRALRDLTSLDHGPEQFTELRHIFAPTEEGFVSVQLTAGTPDEFRWDHGDEHPRKTAGQPYVTLASRCRFLDYKALLETNFVHRTGTPNLFDLLVTKILTDLPVIVSGSLKTLGKTFDQMRALDPTKYQGRRKIQAVRKACEEFNAALTNHLPEVVVEGNRLLEALNQEGLSFQLTPTQVDYDQKKKTFIGQEIALSVQLFGTQIDHPQIFLNEARLTALALAIYLGAAKLVLKSIPAGPDGTAIACLLVLDDVLIGLDLANRLPVLKVLSQEFSDWQIFLLTYDRIWFELAKEFTEQTGRWVYLSLRDMPTGVGQPGRPCVDPCQDFLAVAEKHFQSGDLMASAVYIRAAFETRLKNVCEKQGIKINYKPNPKDVKTDQLWQGIKDRQKERQANSGPDFISANLLNDVEAVRSTVLNRLSHSGVPGLVTKDVRFALDTVKRLQQHEFKKV